MKKFNFDNKTSENIFSHPYISYLANERKQEKEQFHSKNYLLKMSYFNANMRLKKLLQKHNFVMAKAISESYPIDCSCKWPCMFPHSFTNSNAALFLIKAILCETNNIFSKKYLKLGKMNARF